MRLAREGDAFQLAGRIFGIEDDQVIAVAQAGIEADDGLGLEPARCFYFFLKVEQDGAVFFIDQAQIIALRSGFELPLILEERGFVEIGKDLFELVMLADACAPEGGLGNLHEALDGR